MSIKRPPSSVFVTATMFLGGCFLLSGCFSMERFRHEKYSCVSNRLDIREVIIRNAKQGAEVRIISSQAEEKGTISAISKEQAVVVHGKRNLNVDRKTGNITVLVKNRYHRLNCEVSLFTL